MAKITLFEDESYPRYVYNICKYPKSLPHGMVQGIGKYTRKSNESDRVEICCQMGWNSPSGNSKIARLIG